MRLAESSSTLRTALRVRISTPSVSPFFSPAKNTIPSVSANKAKAATNMMMRTCAEDLSRKGIYMNSVDTINDENPRNAAARIAENHNFQTPLDDIDAAARVLDPIFALF
ncbi:hypothetical protein PsorP6_002271 [Peronosclerospora sorghi]|uniref:Uncharacterized protein n=1 Tax=Peronosclerospora sorghi TaxID=230839 RepID=A0ACC0WXW2_9STRA|nr:hypothetical protein PsorP6_002271 [Peronosclerospora sorghi]